MYQVSFGGGTVPGEVQLSWIRSPIRYLSLPPVILGPWVGRSVEATGVKASSLKASRTKAWPLGFFITSHRTIFHSIDVMEKHITVNRSVTVHLFLANNQSGLLLCISYTRVLSRINVVNQNKRNEGMRVSEYPRQKRVRIDQGLI